MEMTPVEEMMRDAIGLVSDARDRNINLRVAGGLGVYIHCHSHQAEIAELYRKVGRVGPSPLGDLDLVAYSSQRKDIVKFLEKEKRLIPNIRFNFMFGFKRMIYEKAGSYEIDVFFDKLQYSHDVVFGSKPGQGRLELDFPTVSLTDLALSKLQIHKITMKDLADLDLLFLFHDIGETDSSENINVKRIAEVLADDWGFWYDADSNLKQAIATCDTLSSNGKTPIAHYDIIKSRIEKLLAVINQTPKSGNWQKRAKIGTTKPWYREVEEVVRT
jgi:hypothetical protein